VSEIVVLTPEELEQLVASVIERLDVSPPPPESSPWLTAREVADRLKVSPQTVHRLSTSAGLPFRQIGPNGEKRFHRAAVDGWLDRQEPDGYRGRKANGAAPRPR
jgi:excisionase family DNA binding protein